jgi:membrane-associated phospholipid phosphatase
MYDVLSASTSLLIIAPIVIYIFSHKPMYLMLGVGTLVATLSAEAIKRYITVGIPEFKRPKGARARCGPAGLLPCKHGFPWNQQACNSRCQGDSAEHESGMPSAHAASTAFAATYILLTCQSNLAITVAILYWLAVCHARYKQNCHTPAQLTAGTVLGAFLAYLTIRLFP